MSINENKRKLYDASLIDSDGESKESNNEMN